MARTSGSACERALTALPGLNDGELAGLDRSLVQQHLEHCGGCRAAALVMTWLGDELAGLADLDPGPGFTAAVVARTSDQSAPARVRRRAQVAGSGPAGLMDRVGRWWSERILVPNFALQAAYVATVLLVLVFATPVSPLRGAPGRVLEVVQAGPAEAPLLGPALQWTSDRAAAGGDLVRGSLGLRWQVVESDWQERVRRSEPARSGVAGHLAAAWRQARDRRTGGVTVELSGALRSGRMAWRAWWHTDSE
jgi:hypothetical protein